MALVTVNGEPIILLLLHWSWNKITTSP